MSSIRNPVAGNAWKYNTSSVIPNKKQKIAADRQESRRVVRVLDMYED